MLVATPYLVDRLGVNRYGMWMLAQAVAGTAGVFGSVGLGDATIKYVAHYRAIGDTAGVRRTIQTTLAIYLGLSFPLAATLVLTAGLLSSSVFSLEPSLRPEATLAIQIAAAGLLVRSVDGVCSSALKGYERYDLVAWVRVIVRAAGLLSAVVVVALGFGVATALAVTIATNAIGAAIQGALSRRLTPGLRLLPWTDGDTAREMFGFGAYSWLQSLGTIAFGQADRLVIGILLGPARVAYYSVCVQLAQQLHAMIAAAFHFMFPLVSARVATGCGDAVRGPYRRALWASVAAATLLAVPLLVFAGPILSLWMGVAFAAQAQGLLAWLAVAFFVLALNVVPHNALLGFGEVRFVSFTNLGGGLLSLVGMIVLIPSMGVTGAAVSRLLYGPVISLNYFRIARRL